MAKHLDPALLTAAERHPDCAGHFDRSLEEVQAIEPRWRELVHSQEPGSVQQRTLACYGGDLAAFLEAAGERIRSAAAAGDAELAAMQALFASHAIADHSGTPAHSCDLGILDILVERPEAFRHRNLHQLLESLPAAADIGTWRPGTWAGDAADAAIETMEAAERERIASGQLLIPLLQALYAGDTATAVALTGAGVTAAARVFARYLGILLQGTGWWRGPRTVRPAVWDLRDRIPADSILDACCDHRIGVDATVVYGEPGRWRDDIRLGGATVPGIAFVPLTPRAAHHPDHPAIPFPHGRCFGLAGWRINPAQRYRLRCLGGHNESVTRGGRLRVGAFSDLGEIHVAETPPGEPAAIDVAVRGRRVWLFAEDLDGTYPPLKYAAFSAPILEAVA